MTTIKPFRPDREWFRIHNYTFDACMPALSNAGWRVLCVAIRKTLGWHSEITDSGRKEWDQISYSQFMEASGLKSPSSISKGIQENLEAGYLLRRQIGQHQGTGAPVYAYALNLDFEVDVPDFATTESVARTDAYQMSTTESVVAATTESELAATTESVETKGKGNTNEKEKGLSSFDGWLAALKELQHAMPAATFNQWFRGSTAQRENGVLTIHTRYQYADQGSADRLRPQILRALHLPEDDPLAVRFEVREAP